MMDFEEFMRLKRAGKLPSTSRLPESSSGLGKALDVLAIVIGLAGVLVIAGHWGWI